MLILNYTPDNPNAILVPDHKAELYVLNALKESWFRSSHMNMDHLVNYASESILTAARVLIAEEVVYYTNIKFMYNYFSVAVDERGMLQNWPKGFAETHYDFIMRIMRTMETKSV